MKRTMAVGLVVVAILGAAVARAEAPKLGEGKGTVTLSWDEFVKITGYDPARKGAQVVTIPWKEVEDLLGVKVEKVAAATVDLPWNEFKNLLEWSIQKRDADLTPPPTDYIVAASQYAGSLADESASFTLTAKINILRKKGWKRIPILPNSVALTKATLGDGVFLNSSGAAYELLTEKTGPIDVSLEFSVAVTKSTGINQVGFPRVLAGSSLLDLAIDREKVDVKVAAAQSLVKKAAAGKTRVAAAVPAGAQVAVSWERELPKIEAAPTKLYAETRTLVAVAEGMLLGQEVVNYNILHTPLRELALQVPAGANVLTAYGPGVKDWRADDKGRLQVVLSAETIGAFSLRLSYEQLVKEQVEAPVVRPLGAELQRGYVGVVAMTSVELSAGKVEGAATVDVRQLPADIAAMTNQPILLGFRYVGEKFAIPLAIKKHEEVGVLVTIVDSGVFTAMQLADGRRITKAIYSVRNNRNQFLRMKMPAGAELWSVSVAGSSASPARDEAGNVLVPLVRSGGGAAELAAFPVEVVYVEAPKAPVPERGTLRVELPVFTAVPALHVMYSYYAPEEGRYTVGWGESGFSGPLKVVEEFTQLRTAGAAKVVKVNAAEQAKQMQQAFDTQVDAAAKAAGATPIRVRLPVNGKLFKLEKVLVLPNETLYFELAYSGWKAAR